MSKTYGTTVPDTLSADTEQAFIALYGDQKAFNPKIPDPAFVPGEGQSELDAPLVDSGETGEAFVNRCLTEHVREVILAARHRAAQDAARQQVEQTAGLDSIGTVS